MDNLTKTITYEIKRLFPNSLGKCLFTCAYCGRQRIVTIPKEFINKTARIKCYCKHSIPVLIVGRSYYRKNVNLPGKLRDSEGLKRAVIIKSISESGIGIALGYSKHNIKPGDVVRVKFQLDDKAFTLLDVSVIIRRVEEGYAGCEFQYLEQHDKKTIGFYMMR